MSVFVDTSALMALCDEDDDRFGPASAYLERQLAGEEHVTHSYVMVESISLVQRRLGMPSVRRLVNGIRPALTVDAVTGPLEAAALTALLASESRRVSFVDRVSFEFMRRHGLTTAFAFDDDFGRAGFQTVP